MTYRPNTDFLQVLLRQLRQDLFVDRIVAECRLILFEAKAPQPNPEVHKDAQTITWRAIFVCARRRVQDRCGSIATEPFGACADQCLLLPASHQIADKPRMTKRASR
jgi:hypothetical protein